MGQIGGEGTEGGSERLALKPKGQVRDLATYCRWGDRGGRSDGLLDAVGAGDGVTEHLGPRSDGLGPRRCLIPRSLRAEEFGDEPSEQAEADSGYRPSGDNRAPAGQGKGKQCPPTNVCPSWSGDPGPAAHR